MLLDAQSLRAINKCLLKRFAWVSVCLSRVAKTKDRNNAENEENGWLLRISKKMKAMGTPAKELNTAGRVRMDPTISDNSLTHANNAAKQIICNSTGNIYNNT